MIFRKTEVRLRIMRLAEVSQTCFHCGKMSIAQAH
jgi:hypothetical protein